MKTAYIGLGSNLDNPEAQLAQAIEHLAQVPGLVLRGASSLYRSAPWGELDQPDFINAVAQVDTTLAPESLLDVLVQIEAVAGRARSRRWGPRTLDLDLLLYEGVQCDLPRLQLPHPRMHERAFVLVPLLELAPDIIIPGHGRARDLLALDDASSVRRVVPIPEPG